MAFKIYERSTCVTPVESALCSFSDPRQIRIETIQRRPPSTMCTSKHTHDAGGIKVATLQQFTMEPKNEYIYTTTTRTSQEYKYIQYKDPNHSGSEILSEYGQEYKLD